MKRKILCLTLCFVFLCSCTFVQASAATSTDTYSELITDVLDRYESGNSSASSAIQQQVNGAYRLVELFALIAMKNTSSTEVMDLISGVLDDWETYDKSASGAEQQLVNGTYRCVELLTIIAMEMDSANRFSDLISSVLDDFNSHYNVHNTDLTAPYEGVNDRFFVIPTIAMKWTF